MQNLVLSPSAGRPAGAVYPLKFGSEESLCPEPVGWRVRFKNRQGWHVVDSCDGHVDDELVGVMRIPNRLNGAVRPQE